LGALILLLLTLAGAPRAWAGPGDWQEVPASAEGRQWWDAGSLHPTRDGHLSVLSRYQPAPDADTAGEGSRPRASELYVMELDCGQGLFRDVSKNGLPRWQAPWQLADGDTLIREVLEAACAAGSSAG
jgi:hypothetical protein